MTNSSSLDGSGAANILAIGLLREWVAYVTNVSIMVVVVVVVVANSSPRPAMPLPPIACLLEPLGFKEVMGW